MFTRENEERDQKIAKLQNVIKEKQELIDKLNEEKKDCDLIIKAYSAFVEQELKGVAANDDDMVLPSDATNRITANPANS